MIFDLRRQWSYSMGIGLFSSNLIQEVPKDGYLQSTSCVSQEAILCSRKCWPNTSKEFTISHIYTYIFPTSNPYITVLLFMCGVCNLVLWVQAPLYVRLFVSFDWEYIFNLWHFHTYQFRPKHWRGIDYCINAWISFIKFSFHIDEIWWEVSLWYLYLLITFDLFGYLFRGH